ncbi:MAG: DNA repair protein RecO C-terminal domain-containing protein [Treponema sp.]|jgi:DNA repair protein RecO (recombination protein O)|nr:DNA repair protein RecO C-terminal domain-containing protein [Treponema sp.]
MSRTAVYTGLVLRSRQSGESNTEITLLTAEDGIIRATVFGGPKSKLRAHSAPYNSGRVWIYRDKAKDYAHNNSYAKLSDFDVQCWRAGLRELYERTMTASAVAQTILTSHGGGGDWGTAFRLAVSTLDALENANDELCPRILIHFLWRWAGFLGIQPNIHNCTECGKIMDDNLLLFDIKEGSSVCAGCSLRISHSASNQEFDHAPNRIKDSALLLQLNPGSRRWLSAVEKLEPSLINRYSMDNSSFSDAKALVTSIMAEALGKRLNSWDW